MIIYRQDGSTLLDIQVDDNSYRYRSIMGDHNLTLYFALAEHTEIPVGAYCDYQGERYTLVRPEALTMQHTRMFEYTVVMESAQAKAKIWKFRNPVDGRLKFPLTAKPHEHLQMFVDNMNRRDTGWTIGNCIEGAEKTISYDHAFCWDALGQQADEFETEFAIEGKTVSLCKVEKNKTNPLPLSYGRGNGFKSGVGRTNYGDTPPIEILYAQGGDRNIDPSKYGSSELHLPKNGTLAYDGEHFEDENYFDDSKAHIYVADENGLSVRRQDGQITTLAEDSLDCTEIYPKNIGTVTSVIVVDESKNFYDFIDTNIPNTLNYEDCLIEGETMTVVFQDGMLAGREFEVKYSHEAKGDKLGKRFEIVPQEIDGQTMPNDTFKPVTGNHYVVFHCMLPDAYINAHIEEGDPKSGAEWDMMRQVIKYLYDHEQETFSFSGVLDGIWAKKDWVNIGGRIVLGGYILFTDARFQTEGVRVRIIGIKDYINNPHCPEIELSNSTVTGSFSTSLRNIESKEVLTEEYRKEVLQFTKRRFRDAQETMQMLESSLLENFTQSISPIAVQTMMMLVGDESLQFQFIDTSTTPPTVVTPNIVYSQVNKQLTCPKSTIQHLTLGINSVSSEHSQSDFKCWDLPQYISGRLDDGAAKYYLYAVCQETSGSSIGIGEFILSETAKPLKVGSQYNLLVGVLNSEYNGERSYVSLYGFTEVLPGRITTDRIVSGNGQSYFDLVANALKLGNKLKFNEDGEGKLVLSGTIVQSEGGDESVIGCFRGVYDQTQYYYNGDEVTYTFNGCTSTYRFINSVPARGIAPTNTTYWQIVAQGQAGSSGNSTFKSTVFRRINSTPDTPTGGNYASPIPTGGLWSDGIPTGEEKLWASTRIFTSDGQSPQQSSWTTPRQLTDTADFDVEFSSEETPDPPTGHPNTNPDWSDESDENTLWMATSRKSNGVWSDWQVQKIKGEKGEPGTDGVSPNTAFKSIVFKRTNTAPSAPTPQQGSYNNPVPSGWSDGIPSGEEKLWMTTRIFSSDGQSPQQPSWTAPRQVTDTSDLDIEFSSVLNPNAPTGHPNTNPQWGNTSDETTIWMATSKKKNGVWSSWQMQRIKGENGQDGTSVRIIGSFYALFETMSEVTQATLPSGAYGLVNTNDEVEPEENVYYVYNNGTNIHATKAEIGDAFIRQSNGHLFMADADKWQDVGQIKGDKGNDGTNGSNAYVHIKYAKSETVNDWSDNDGETPDKYIGIYADNNPTDQLVWNFYTWKKWTGEDGFGYEYIYKRTNSSTAPDTPTETSQEDDYVPVGWTDNPSGVSDSNMYEYVCYRKKTYGVWGEFIGQHDNPTKAALWAKYGQAGPTGNYAELRYAKNGSTTTPPSLTRTAVNPTGWSTTPPQCGLAEYLWMTKTVKSSSGSLIDLWSVPVRVSGINGQDGQDGKSITSVINYYAICSSGQIAPTTGWQENVIPAMTASNPYLWNYEVVKDEDGSIVSQTDPACIGNLSKDGVSITNVKECYRLTSIASAPLSPILNSAHTAISDMRGWSWNCPVTSDASRFLWNIEVIYYSNGTLSLTSAHLTGVQGVKGDNGKSPAMVYRGEYDSSKTYYGNQYRLDCVKYGSAWYIARIDAGEFSGIAPTDTGKWNSFGASFESVATQLLLAENANIAGWIFRNGRLESEKTDSQGNPVAFLNGNTGEMRLKGALQLSTGISGNYSDVNLFYLPATNSVKYLSMGHEDEDVGKVVRLYNSGTFSNKSYYIRGNKWQKDDDFVIETDTFSYELKPQEVVEMTCMATSEITDSGYSAEWMITARFSQNDFRNNSQVGRYPMALAIGRIHGKDSSSKVAPYIDGRFYDGRYLSDLFNIVRNGTGDYSITFASGLLGSSYHIFFTGLNNNWKGSALNCSNNGFDVYIADDATLNDGDVEFMILGENWWYNLV